MTLNLSNYPQNDDALTNHSYIDKVYKKPEALYRWTLWAKFDQEDGPSVNIQQTCTPFNQTKKSLNVCPHTPKNDVVYIHHVNTHSNIDMILLTPRIAW